MKSTKKFNALKTVDYEIEKFSFFMNYKDSFKLRFKPVETVKSVYLLDNNTNGFFLNSKSDAKAVFKYLCVKSYFHVWSVFLDEKKNLRFIVPGYLITATHYYLSDEKWANPTEAYVLENVILNE